MDVILKTCPWLHPPQTHCHRLILTINQPSQKEEPLCIKCNVLDEARESITWAAWYERKCLNPSEWNLIPEDNVFLNRKGFPEMLPDEIL